MINPGTKYPGKTAAPTAAYPQGAARNVSAPGAGDGSPLEEAWLNDWWGLGQAMLASLGEVPNTIPEQVGNSQLLQVLAAYAAGRGNVFTDGGAVNVYALTPPANVEIPPAYFNGQAARFTPTNTNTGASTVQVGALGVKAIVDQDGNPLTGGELDTLRMSTVRYDFGADNFVLDETNRGANVLAFSTSQAYVPSAGVRAIKVEVQGAGGGGGGTSNPGGGAGQVGGGGASGGYAAGLYRIQDLTGPFNITVGAGGVGGTGAANGTVGGNAAFADSGALNIVSTGGQGGAGSAGPTASDRGATAGTRGGGSGANLLNLSGESGSIGSVFSVGSGPRCISANGGSSMFGKGPGVFIENVQGVIINGGGFGSGGGGVARSGGGGNGTGGDGTSGLVIITEYF